MCVCVWGGGGVLVSWEGCFFGPLAFSDLLDFSCRACLIRKIIFRESHHTAKQCVLRCR